MKRVVIQAREGEGTSILRRERKRLSVIDGTTVVDRPRRGEN